jgi:microtubule-associated protein-like 1/2
VKAVNKSHYSLTKDVPSEVTALMAHPEMDGGVFSCGDDGTLRQWDFKTRRCLRVLNLNIDKQGNLLSMDPNTKEIRSMSKLQTIDISPKNEIIAVGCEDGTVRIVSIKTWSQISLFRHRRSKIRVAEFSPDGLSLAIACDEGFVDLYSVPHFKILYRLKKSSSSITHLDWSTDSKFIQYSNMEDELVYVDVKKGAFLKDGFAMLRDETWKEWKVPFGWPLQGLYNPANVGGSAINCLHRGPPHREWTPFVAAGFVDSRIRVYRYPALNYNAEFIELLGHAGPINDINFSPNGNYMFSTGAEDLAVIQWKISSVAKN